MDIWHFFKKISNAFWAGLATLGQLWPTPGGGEGKKPTSHPKIPPPKHLGFIWMCSNFILRPLGGGWGTMFFSLKIPKRCTLVIFVPQIRSFSNLKGCFTVPLRLFFFDFCWVSPERSIFGGGAFILGRCTGFLRYICLSILSPNALAFDQHGNRDQKTIKKNCVSVFHADSWKHDLSPMH